MYILLIKYALLVVGVILSALGLWELREGNSKKSFLTYTIVGAFMIMLSQLLVSLIGVLGIFR